MEADSQIFLYPHVYHSISHCSQDMKTNLVSVKHTHTLVYYSAIKHKEILPFATAWRECEGIMLNKISRTKTNIVIYVESKKAKLVETERRMVVNRCQG